MKACLWWNPPVFGRHDQLSVDSNLEGMLIVRVGVPAWECKWLSIGSSALDSPSRLCVPYCTVWFAVLNAMSDYATANMYDGSQHRRSVCTCSLLTYLLCFARMSGTK